MELPLFLNILPIYSNCFHLCKFNADLPWTGRTWTNFDEMWVKIRRFSFRKMHMKVFCKRAAILCRPRVVYMCIDIHCLVLHTILHRLTHWGRVTHICVGKLTIIGSDNGLSPGRRQAIIWTNAGILLIGPVGTNFNEILIGIQTFSFKKMHLKVSSAKWRPCCLGHNVLIIG